MKVSAILVNLGMLVVLGYISGCSGNHVPQRRISRIVNGRRQTSRVIPIRRTSSRGSSRRSSPQRSSSSSRSSRGSVSHRGGFNMPSGGRPNAFNHQNSFMDRNNLNHNNNNNNFNRGNNQGNNFNNFDRNQNNFGNPPQSFGNNFNNNPPNSFNQNGGNHQNQQNSFNQRPGGHSNIPPPNNGQTNQFNNNNNNNRRGGTSNLEQMAIISALLGVDMPGEQQNTARRLLLAKLLTDRNSLSGILGGNLGGNGGNQAAQSSVTAPPAPGIIDPRNQFSHHTGQNNVVVQSNNPNVSPLVIEANGKIKVSEIQAANGQTHVVIDASQAHGAGPNGFQFFNPLMTPLKPGEDPPEIELPQRVMNGQQKSILG